MDPDPVKSVSKSKIYFVPEIELRFPDCPASSGVILSNTLPQIT
jgi:hypothetical protein